MRKIASIELHWQRLGHINVVNFLCGVTFIFPFFLGMVMYANEVETREK